MVEGMKDVVWTDKLMKEITGNNKTTKEIKCDNLNMVRLANSGNYKSRLKLLNGKYHFVKECMRDNDIYVTHVPGPNMKADCLTKALSGLKLYKNIKDIIETD